MEEDVRESLSPTYRAIRMADATAKIHVLRSNLRSAAVKRLAVTLALWSAKTTNAVVQWRLSAALCAIARLQIANNTQTEDLVALRLQEARMRNTAVRELKATIMRMLRGKASS